jgi:intracellular septation protein
LWASATALDLHRPAAHHGTMTEPAQTKPAELNPILKLVLDLGPLLLFFFVNARFGIYAATGAFMAATIVSLIVTYVLIRRIAIMPLVSAIVVMVFGGLTIWFQNETFIKVKPTIIYSLFAVLLLGGLAFGRSLIAIVLDSMFSLDAEGWRKLTLRWGLFFVVMAVVNELVWRSVSTDAWVAFKTFGFLPLTVLFALAQTPLMMRHSTEKK